MLCELGYRARDGVRIAAALRLNKALGLLSLDRNRLKSDGVVPIAAAVGGTASVRTTLTALHLSRNHVGTSGAKAIAEHVLTTPDLRVAKKAAFLEVQMLKQLATSLPEQRAAVYRGPSLKRALPASCLVVLNLSGNPIGDQGIAWIATALKTNNHLKTLVVNRCKLTSQAGKLLGEGLARNSCLTRIE